LFDILKTNQNDDAAASARYYAAVERLSAAGWRRVSTDADTIETSAVV